MIETILTREIKAHARQVTDTLPAALLKGKIAVHKPHYHKRKHITELEAIEQSYNQLDGEWHDWLLVAKRYEHKVPNLDRYDMRHTILIELAKARQRDDKPIPLLRAYRIASLTVALYWREKNKSSVKVCIYSGPAADPHCASCSHKPKALPCPYLATRPIQSLDQEATDSEGNKARLMDTVADDNAIDLDAWLDAKTFRLGCPMRLVEVGYKRLNSIQLTGKDRKYLCKMLKRYQKPLF